jgi:hypothetical protein
MKKRILGCALFALILTACSTEDDGSETPIGVNLQGHYSLRVNGAEFNDELFTMDRDTIEAGNLGVKFTASDFSSNSLFFAIPTAEEGNQYSITAYSSNTTSTASLILSQSGIWLSEDGSVTITEIEIDGNCQITKGNFAINFRRQDNQPGTLNVQGSFDVPTYSCD